MNIHLQCFLEGSSVPPQHPWGDAKGHRKHEIRNPRKLQSSEPSIIKKLCSSTLQTGDLKLGCVTAEFFSDIN